MADAIGQNLFGDLGVPVKRAEYARTGFTLAVIKYLGDVALIYFANGGFWSPLEYLHTIRVLMFTRIPNAPSWPTALLLLWMLPFVWVGVMWTMRRALDAGWSPWVALLFFVPYVNYAVMLTFCLWPSSDKYALGERWSIPEEGDFWANGIPAVAASLLLALAMIAIAVTLKGNYGFGLFVGTPVGMGAVGGFLASRKSGARIGDLALLVLLTNIVAGFVLLAVAFEGAICIGMAFPFAMALGLIGALLGREIARGGRAIRRPAASALLLLPLFALIEPANLTGQLVHEVHSAIEIDAPPDLVWPLIVQSTPMEAPTEMMFRLGIAYPIGTHTSGEGVGATRYCEFSTGEIEEPITAWEPGKRLAFDVISQPAPLVELSIYKDVSPPHLHGYVRSKRGEFRLVALPGGRTRLEGTSWYELQMAPEMYWSLWVDSTVHSVHYRVFREIKREAEARERALAQPR